MVQINQFSKVLNAIKAVIESRLRSNSDDTLTEKLYSLLKYDLNLDLEQIKAILIQVEQSIDLSSIESNEQLMETNLLAKIRILGSLLSDERLFDPQLKCLHFIKVLSNNVTASNDSSLKFAYFKFLNDICCHPSGCDWTHRVTLEISAPIKSFPHLLLHFMNTTQSRFVEQEVQQLFIRLLNHSLLPESVTFENFEDVFAQLINPLKPLSVEIIRQVLLSSPLKREFILKYDITGILMDNIDFWIESFDEKVYQICETLGLCCENNEKALSVISKLIQRSQLKAVIALLTNLIVFDKSLSNKWLTYSMGSLAINSELINRFDLSIDDKTFIESFSSKNISDYSLKQILKVDQKCFDAQQIQLIIETLFNYIKLNENNRKTIVQSLSVLEQISLNWCLNKELVDILLATYAQLLILLPNNLKLILLKSLRLLIRSKVSNYQNTAINKVIRELNSILKNNTIDDNNWEIIDSVLEVIYCVSIAPNGILFTSVCPELMVSIISIWTTNKDNLCSTLRATLVSIIIIIFITVSKEDQIQLCVTNQLDLQSLLSLLFNDELVVKTAIINTLNDNISLLLKMETQNTLLFNQMIETLCEVSVVDLDDDLQLNSLEVLQRLFVGLIDEKELSYLISLFYKSGLFHIVYYITNCSSILFKVKIKSVEMLDQIRDKLIALYGKSISTALESIIPQNDQLTSIPSSPHSNVFRLSQINCLNRNTIINFLLNYDTNQIRMSASEDSPDLSVLDDILSVSQFDSDILIDCY